MAYLEDKIIDLEKALSSWSAVLDAPFSDVIRDAGIQRYEYSFELLWKVLKLYLKEHESIECFSPKSCMREIRPFLNLSEEEMEVALNMANDRNESVHTYSEKMANALYEKLPNYFKLSEKILEKIKTHLN